MFDSRYYKKKFVCVSEDGKYTLCDVSDTLDGKEYCKYVPDEDKPGEYGIYLLRNPKETFKNCHITPLRTFLKNKGYTDKDFINPFCRTKRIVNEIASINIINQNKNKVKQK